jgi:hypothetical protein
VPPAAGGAPGGAVPPAEAGAGGAVPPAAGGAPGGAVPPAEAGAVPPAEGVPPAAPALTRTQKIQRLEELEKNLTRDNYMIDYINGEGKGTFTPEDLADYEEDRNAALQEINNLKEIGQDLNTPEKVQERLKQLDEEEKELERTVTADNHQNVMQQIDDINAERKELNKRVILPGDIVQKSKDSFTFKGQPIFDFSKPPANINMDDLLTKDTTDMSTENIEALNRQMEELLNEKIDAPKGSAEYLTKNSDEYKLLNGQDSQREDVSQLHPTVDFKVNGDKGFEMPLQDNKSYIKDFSGNTFVRTPLGLIQVSSANGNGMETKYREMVQRMQDALKLGTPDQLEMAKEIYNGIPSEHKGFSKLASKEAHQEKFRNMTRFISGARNVDNLKARFNAIRDHTSKDFSADKLLELRKAYKIRKQSLRNQEGILKQGSNWVRTKLAPKASKEGMKEKIQNALRNSISDRDLSRGEWVQYRKMLENQEHGIAPR